MLVKRCVLIALSAILVLVGVLAACAAPAPTPTPTQTPTLTPTPTAAGPLAQIIAGAKKEGTVTVGLRSAFTELSMKRLEREIKETFGVDLAIKFVPMPTYAPFVAQSIMEDKAGATPSFDLMNFSEQYLVQGFQAGIFEKVDWKPLLLESTNSDVVLRHPAMYGSVIYYTAHSGIMYNPEKVSSDKVPETFGDLADPRWKGKVGVQSYPASWTRLVFIRGKEKTLADLRAIMKNNAVPGFYTDLNQRYLLGEIWMAYMNSIYLKLINDKGMPVAWQSLEFAEIAQHCVVARTRAVHPNAAKLVGVYLASPKGVKWSWEESGSGNLYYSGNVEHDIMAQNERQGIPVFSLATDQKLLDFVLSEECAKWEKETELILKGG